MSYLVSYGSRSKPRQEFFDQLRDAILFAQARDMALIYNQALNLQAFFLRGQWYTTTLADVRISDPVRYLVGFTDLAGLETVASGSLKNM